MAKTKSRSTLLLKIVCVLFVVYALYFALTTILSLLNVELGLPYIGLVSAAPGWVNAVLLLIAGVLGYRCKSKLVCYILGLAILVFSLYVFISSMIVSFSVGMLLTGLIPVVLAALYYYGVKKSA